MRIYRFILPKQDNAGSSMIGSFSLLKDYILDVIGGYTEQPEVAGVWKDSQGQFYRDGSFVLDVAIGGDFRAQAVKSLIHRVRSLWPDQISFFVADIGEAHFVPGLADPVGLTEEILADVARGRALPS